MTQLVAVEKESYLSKEEQEAFNERFNKMREAIHLGQVALKDLVENVVYILDHKLWRGQYASEEEFIKTELNIEKSSFERKAKGVRNYVYLLASTDDPDEQETLTRMTPSAYRELRQLATDNSHVLKKGGESDESYKSRLQEKEATDAELIADLWKEIYPRVVRFKRESETGVYPTGGYSITAKDITETARVIAQTINIPRQIEEGRSPSEIAVGSLEGRDISLEEVIEKGGDYTSDVISAVVDLGVSEALTEKLSRQREHIKESLEKKYVYDKYIGTLVLKYNRLIIENEYGDHDLLSEFSDMIDQETVISIRRNV